MNEKEHIKDLFETFDNIEIIASIDMPNDPEVKYGLIYVEKDAMDDEFLPFIVIDVLLGSMSHKCFEKFMTSGLSYTTLNRDNIKQIYERGEI